MVASSGTTTAVLKITAPHVGQNKESHASG